MARIEFVGHSTVLIEQAGTRILTDPLVRERVGYILRDAPLPRIADLQRLDAILISHAHGDHLDAPSLKRLAHGGPVVAPLGVAPILRRAGVADVIELTAGDRCTVGGLGIEAVHAEHDGRRHPLARPLPALGYLIDGPARVYFAGDTDLFPEMAALAGRVDVALLPISGWGPRVPAGHLDPAGAARAVELIRPRVAIPIHWGTMRRVALRPAGDAPAIAFADAVAAGATSTAVRILHTGQSMWWTADMSEDARPVVVAFDGSPEARAAVSEAAKLFPARPLLIVSVWEPGLALAVEPSYDLTGAGPTLPSAEEIGAVDHAQHEHATRAADEGARLARELGATATALPVADEAHVWETLVAVADRNDAAAIVTGSRGLGGVKARFMGSTSRDLLRHSDRPVLVVKTPA